MVNNLLADNRVTLVFGAVVAVTAAICVAFGVPSAEAPHRSSKSSKKRKKRKDQEEPRGLYNSGNTCFVNAVLQAVAACPSLLLWLEENGNQYVQQAKTRHHLQTSLLTVLRVINGFDGDEEDANLEHVTGDPVVGDPEVWAPARLFKALSAQGWVANYQEQDAHEFFQTLFATLEDELKHDSKQGRSALMSLLVQDDEEDSAQGKDEQVIKSEEDDVPRHPLPGGDAPEDDRRGRRRERRKTRSRSSSGVVVRSSAGTELTMTNVKKQTGISGTSLTPFTGTLTNKVCFKQTGKSKSPTSSTTFNNITLTLPQSSLNGSTSIWMGGAGMPVTLETLLTMFVSLESVSASSSSKECDSLVKQLTFAKLPECLALHIQRTAYENGFPVKRNDQVLFPTILNMDNYAYNRQLAKRKAIARSASVTSPTESEFDASSCLSSLITSPTEGLPSSHSSFNSLSAHSNESFNNNYSLRAVVVHMGGIDSGHFVTYRREPFCPVESGSKVRNWYYTSDSVVRMASVEEVLKSNPYMLFYEKIHPEHSPEDV